MGLLEDAQSYQAPEKPVSYFSENEKNIKINNNWFVPLLLIVFSAIGIAIWQYTLRQNMSKYIVINKTTNQ